MNVGSALRWSAFVLLIAVMAFSCAGQDDDDVSDPMPTDDDDSSPQDDDDSDDWSDDDDDDEPGKATVLFPPYPFWENDALSIDLEHIEQIATDYCAQAGDQANLENFLYFALPLRAVDMECTGNPDPTQIKTYMGDMYLSGYFGGLWLRQILHPSPKDGDTKQQDFLSLRPLFNLLTGPVASKIGTVQNPDEDALLEAARKDLNFLIYLYAYNRGYLEHILENPPPGLTAPPNILDCDGELVIDCDCPGVSLDVLERFRPALAKLYDPPNTRWEQMVTLDELGAFAIWTGNFMWEMIGIDSLTELGYLTLLDLSAGFLMVSQAAVLGNMTAWADIAPEEGKCSLLIDAAMIVWGGSYAMGLASPDESGENPQLICP